MQRFFANKHLKRYGLPAIIIAALLACVPWIMGGRTLPEGLIQVNGRLEGERITVSTQYAGRIYHISAAEGDQVKAGQEMARLEDDQLRMQLSQAQAALQALQKQVAAEEAAVGVQQQEMPLLVEQSQAAVTHARAERDKSHAARQQALRDSERTRALRSNGAVSEERLEQANLALTAASMDTAVAEASLSKAHTALASARLESQRILARQSGLEALRAERAKAQAALEELRCIIGKHIIKAPADGAVTTKLVSLGETLAPGAPLFDLVDLDRLYVKAYVPEPMIGKIKLGSEVQVYTDAFPQQPVSATVGYIAPRAEFTPKEVQTRDERIKQVFAVKLYLKANPGRALSPGMPADAVIRWKKDAAWQAPRP